MLEFVSQKKSSCWTTLIIAQMASSTHTLTFLCLQFEHDFMLSGCKNIAALILLFRVVSFPASTDYCPLSVALAWPCPPHPVSSMTPDRPIHADKREGTVPA